MQCPKCNKTYDAGLFCEECGTKLVPSGGEVALPEREEQPPPPLPIASVLRDPPNTVFTPNPAFEVLGNCPMCGASADHINPENGVCVDCQSQRVENCPQCGASPASIAIDGFCSDCGTPRLASKENHNEIVLGPECASVCDLGKTHLINQDRHGAKLITVEGQPIYILVVCDGVSGSSAGGPAAEAGVTAALASAKASLEKRMSPSDALILATRAAQEAVLGLNWTPQPMAHGRPDEPPSATFLMAIVVNNQVTYGWLGDSRAYWVTERHSGCLVRDHSWINEQLDLGRKLDEVIAEARSTRMSRAIVRSLGVGEDPPEVLAPEKGEFTLPPGAVLVLCSDGLHVYLDDAAADFAVQVRQQLGKDALAMARSLVAYANARGGNDNVTALVYISKS